MMSEESPQRKTREQEQASFLDEDENFETLSWREHWWGMPSFIMGDARPMFRVTVNFVTVDDMMDFARRLDVIITTRTNSLWFPPDVVSRPSEWEFVDEP
jgi:hypothetical protein